MAEPPNNGEKQAGNCSNGICRVIDASRSPSPDPKRYETRKETIPMHAPKQIFLLVFAFVACTSITFAKNAGDLLKQYIENPKKAVKGELLALVEIVSIDTDTVPENNCKQTGTLHLRLIESVGGEVPKDFTVRFFKRHAESLDAWTWDHANLTVGKRLLGFFNQWETKWAVRQDGRTNVINNPENIDKDLIKRVQLLFKTALQPMPEDKKQSKVPEDTARKLADPQQ